MKWRDLKPGDVVFSGPLQDASQDAHLVIRVGRDDRFDTLMSVTVLDLQHDTEMMARPAATELNAEYVILRGQDIVTS